MEKKKYLSPRMQVIEIGNMSLLAGSGVQGSGTYDMGYGGIDDGTHDPD